MRIADHGGTKSMQENPLTKGRHSCSPFKSGIKMAIIAILCLLPAIGIAASGQIILEDEQTDGQGREKEITLYLQQTDGQTGTSPVSTIISPTLPTKELLPPSNDCKILKKNLSAMSSLLLKAPPYNGGFYDTSSYMAGKVAVGIILPESIGDTENWTQDEVTKVISEIKTAMDWWASIEPDAHLSFYYDIHTPFDGTQSVKIASEPIVTNSEKPWINQVMNAMGYTNPGTGFVEDYFYRVFDYNNHIRDMLGTNWAFTIFVADSSNDTDGNFPNSRFAYAYLGGPFMVMTYDNGNYGIENMDSCCAHETGHIFYALDEYKGESSKTKYSGYLNVINGNHESVSCSVPCIMKGLIPPFANKQVCHYTRGQLGLWDTDIDNILDVLDSSPNIFLTSYPTDPTSNQSPTYIGIALVTIVPNKNPQETPPIHDITINTISQVKYRINNGSWLSATASDGIFDEPEEEFTFTLASLNDRTHTLEIKAIDSAGNISNYNTNTINDAQPNLDAVVVYPIPFRQSTGDTHIIFKGLTNDANIRIYNLAGDIIREQDHVSISWRWPVIDEGISSGVYFFVVTEEGKKKRVGRIVIIR